MQAQSLGREGPLEESTATHSSVLAWRTQGQRGLAGYSPKCCRVGHGWSNLALTHGQNVKPTRIFCQRIATIWGSFQNNKSEVSRTELGFYCRHSGSQVWKEWQDGHRFSGHWADGVNQDYWDGETGNEWNGWGGKKKKPSNASVAGVPSSKSFRNKRVTEI